MKRRIWRGLLPAAFLLALPTAACAWRPNPQNQQVLRLQRQVAGYKLLIIDELGYVPLSQTGAELLFEVFSQRYERGSTIVTSNLPFDEWTGVFASERLTGALARPADSPRPHPRDERRQLPAQTEQASIAKHP